MKKLTKTVTSFLLTTALLLALTACGGSGGDKPAAQESPDLNKYYTDFMATLGEENTPAMMDLTEAENREYIENFFPGLTPYVDEAKQAVVQMAVISSVAYEFVLLEMDSEEDAAAVGTILQNRQSSQAGGGAFYPETTAAWETAMVTIKGNVAALIVAQEEQAQAEEAFNALFA